MELSGIVKAKDLGEVNIMPTCFSSFENSRTAVALLERQSLRVRWGNRRFWELADTHLINALKYKSTDKLPAENDGEWDELIEAVQGAAQAWPPYRCKGCYPVKDASGDAQAAPFLVSVSSRDDGPSDIVLEMLEPETQPGVRWDVHRFSRVQQGVYDALGVLLSGKPVSQAFHHVLQTLGEAADVHVAFLMQHDQTFDAWTADSFMQWSPDGQSGVQDSASWACALGDHTDLLCAGKPVHGEAGAFFHSESVRGEILIVPLCSDGCLLGAIGFHDTKDGRAWRDAEVSLVYAIAGGLAAVLSSQGAPSSLEDALYQSEERLSLAMAASRGGFWEIEIKNLDPLIIEDKSNMSPGQKRIIGYCETQSPEHGDVWLRHVLTEDLPALHAAIKDHYKTHSPFFETEYRVYHSDGSLRWVATRGKVVASDNGTPSRCIGIIWDITERKAVEQEREQLLRERERQRECLEKLIDHAPVGIAVVQGPDHHVVLANPVFCSFAPDKQVLHSPLAQVVADGPADFSQMLTDVRATGLPSSLSEYQTKDTNGNCVFWNINIVPLHEVEGAIDTVLIILLDVTEQVSTRRRLAELAKAAESNFLQLEAVINNMTEGVIICSAEGWIVHMNPAAHFIHGFSSQNAPVTLADLRDSLQLFDLSGAPIPTDDWPVAQVLSGLRFTDKAFRVSRKDKTREWIASYSGTPITDQYGRVSIAVVTVRDVTQAKQHERQLKDWNEALEQRIGERTKSLLKYQSQLRDLATELSRAEQRERRHLATELHDYLAQLLVACKMKLGQANGIVRSKLACRYLVEADQFLNNCLSYTRTLIAELSPSVLYEAGLGAALKWLADQMIQHDLTVEVVELAPIADVPDDQAILIFQSVRELLFNVIKHSDVKTASLGLDCDVDRILITVQDQGKGFNAQEEIKKPGKYGLFSIHERLEAIGACLSVESSPGAGTCASIILPLRALSAAKYPDDSVGAPPQAAVVKSQARLIRVLVADDHSIIRSGLRTLLDSSSDLHVIGEASNGEEAVELAQKLRPDVIIMDVNMPKLNGIQATRIIKRDLPDIEIVGLSVFNDQQIEKSMIDAGAFAMLSKGGPPEDLCQTLRSTRPAN